MRKAFVITVLIFCLLLASCGGGQTRVTEPPESAPPVSAPPDTSPATAQTKPSLQPTLPPEVKKNMSREELAADLAANAALDGFNVEEISGYAVVEDSFLPVGENTALVRIQKDGVLKNILLNYAEEDRVYWSLIGYENDVGFVKPEDMGNVDLETALVLIESLIARKELCYVVATAAADVDFLPETVSILGGEMVYVEAGETDSLIQMLVRYSIAADGNISWQLACYNLGYGYSVFEG